MLCCLREARDGIASLVAKSLVALNPTRATTRWYLLETIRAYALERLTEHGETDTVSSQHAVYFRDLITPPVSGARTILSDADLTRFVREIDNVRAAVDWCFSSAGDPAIGVDLTVAYTPVWRHLSLMSECRERCAALHRTQRRTLGRECNCRSPSRGDVHHFGGR